MFYLIGLIVSSICVVLSVFQLKQDIINYFDFVGFLVVLGGTCSLVIMTFPWQLATEIKQAIIGLLMGKKIDMRAFNLTCYQFVQSVNNGVAAPTQRKQKILGEEILTDGLELIQLGFQKDKIEKILEERIFQWAERMTRVSSAFRSLAKYPPAFGLVGTVLGLVSLMRAISQGTSSTETGVRMAVALVSTLYGLVTANLIVNPAGERISVMATEERKSAELAMRAVLLAEEAVSLLEAQEVLNSFVRPGDRVKLGDSFTSEDRSEPEIGVGAA